MFGLSKKKVEPRGFWHWLRENTNRIQTQLNRNATAISEEISEEFGLSYPDLVWEVGPSETDSWVFSISADGQRELFPAVIDAVREAPPIPGWIIESFRSRGSLSAEIRVNGRSLGYEDIWCSVQPTPQGIDLTLWIRGLTTETDSEMSGAAVLLLDNAIGEYDAVMKISSLDRADLPDVPARRSDFFPLAELPAYLDEHIQTN